MKTKGIELDYGLFFRDQFDVQKIEDITSRLKAIQERAPKLPRLGVFIMACFTGDRERYCNFEDPDFASIRYNAWDLKDGKVRLTAIEAAFAGNNLEAITMLGKGLPESSSESTRYCKTFYLRTACNLAPNIDMLTAAIPTDHSFSSFNQEHGIPLIALLQLGKAEMLSQFCASHPSTVSGILGTNRAGAGDSALRVFAYLLRFGTTALAKTLFQAMWRIAEADRSLMKNLGEFLCDLIKRFHWKDCQENYAKYWLNRSTFPELWQVCFGKESPLGTRILCEAVRIASPKEVEFILHHLGVNPGGMCPVAMATPLTLACYYQSKRSVELILEASDRVVLPTLVFSSDWWWGPLFAATYPQRHTDVVVFKNTPHARATMINGHKLALLDGHTFPDQEAILAILFDRGGFKHPIPEHRTPVFKSVLSEMSAMEALCCSILSHPSDGLLALTPTQAAITERNTNAKRFFGIMAKLHYDVKRRVCASLLGKRDLPNNLEVLDSKLKKTFSYYERKKIHPDEGEPSKRIRLG